MGGKDLICGTVTLQSNVINITRWTIPKSADKMATVWDFLRIFFVLSLLREDLPFGTAVNSMSATKFRRACVEKFKRRKIF